WTFASVRTGHPRASRPRPSAALVAEGRRPVDREARADEIEQVGARAGLPDRHDRDAADGRLRDIAGEAGRRRDVADVVQHLGLDRGRARDGAARAPPLRGRPDPRPVPCRMRDHVGDHPGATELDGAHDQGDEEGDDHAHLHQRLAAVSPAGRECRHSARLPEAASTTSVPSPSGTLYGRVIAPGAAAETRSGSSDPPRTPAVAMVPTVRSVSPRRPRRTRWIAMITPPSAAPTRSAVRAARGPRRAPMAPIILTSPPPRAPSANGDRR